MVLQIGINLDLFNILNRSSTPLTTQYVYVSWFKKNPRAEVLTPNPRALAEQTGAETGLVRIFGPLTAYS